MSEIVILVFVLSILNGLLGTKTKEIKLNTWHKIKQQLETILDFYSTSTLI